MTFETPWAWLVGALAGWLFLGLVAGRFTAARNQMNSPGASDPGVDAGNRRRGG